MFHRRYADQTVKTWTKALQEGELELLNDELLKQ